MEIFLLCNLLLRNGSLVRVRQGSPKNFSFICTMKHLNIEESRFCNRIILMNKFYIYFFLFFLSFSNFSYATKVYLTDFESQADYKIFTVSSPSQADCKVYMVSQESRAQRGTGKWYKVDQPSRADVKIANVEHQSRADIKVYFVSSESQASKTCFM